MKSQVEITSYVMFSFLIITVTSIIIYYFWFFSKQVMININKINLYSFSSILEFPLISINSVCSFCKVTYYVSLVPLNISSQNQFIMYYDVNEKKIKYEEIYSNTILSSSLLNLLELYSIFAFATSQRGIVFEINNFDRTLLIRNV